MMERILHSFVERNRGYLRYPMIFVTAAIVAASELFGEVTPIAPVFIGSLAGIDCLFAFLGTLCAFAFKGQFFEAVPTLSIMMVIGVFRFFLGSLPSKLITLASSLLTGISVGVIGTLTATRPSDIISAVIMAITAGILSYCLTITYRFLAGGYMTALLKFSSVAAPGIVMVFAAAVLSNLSYVNEFTINIGVLFGGFTSLAFANKYRHSGGSISGIMTAVGVMLATPDLSTGMVIFAAAATASGLFARFGRITQSAGFMLCLGIGISAVGINTYTLSVMAGAAAGSILYIIVPIDIIALSKIGSSTAYSGKTVGAGGTDISEIFAERLRLASGALSDVKSAVEKAGEILDKRNSKDFSWVYNTAGDMVCRKCKNNMICWGNEYSDTVSAFNKVAANLRKGKPLSERDLPPRLAARCEQKQQLLFALSERYREFTTMNSANRKISEMRTVLTAQLAATESLMLDMSDEFLDYSHYDHEMASQMEKILSDNGITRPRAAVLINEGRASVEGYGKGTLACEAARLGDFAAESLQRQFDLPEITYVANGENNPPEFRFTMHERAVYGVEYGAYQLSKSNERSCGDYYDSFVDGKGYAYIILSDGMGSGSRARIDSAFACGMLVKLLRAGIGLPSSLEIINNSLLVKSSDESFATLDICRIDLYTGKAELYKAGAAASYIRCNKRFVKAAGKGLPVGIGYRAVYESQSFTIGNSDMIIMASDGAELNEKWLEHQLSDNKNSTDLNETAKLLANTARYSAFSGGDNPDDDEKGREDDISVIAVKLVK
ncbi:MAG: SpoIIE family protein phosphatase [Oscillospiraceae bacterium]|nr:SpoIIE family protein phosphatase [Oscillospiraceae bacterium]